MRRLILCLLGPVWAVAARAAPIRFDFETGNPFQLVGTAGTLRLESAQPLAGANSLSLELPVGVNELTVISAPFAVRPFHVYELRWQTRVDLGVTVSVRLRSDTAAGAHEVHGTWGSATAVSWLYAPPGVKQAQLILGMRAPGQTVGRRAVLDEIALIDRGPLRAGRGQEMFFNGSFELLDVWPPPGWTWWSHAPEFRRSTDAPYAGANLLHTKGADYLVLPSVYARDRDLLHLRLWLRGDGDVSVAVHHVSLDIHGRRIGWSVPGTGNALTLRPGVWQPVDVLMAALGGACYFQPIVMPQRRAVDIDGVSVRRVGPDFGSHRGDTPAR